MISKIFGCVYIAKNVLKLLINLDETYFCIAHKIALFYANQSKNYKAFYIQHSPQNCVKAHTMKTDIYIHVEYLMVFISDIFRFVKLRANAMIVFSNYPITQLV